MATAKKTKLPTKKAIAIAKREAKAVQKAADFEKTKASLSPQNRQHLEKFIAAKNKPKSAGVAKQNITLSAERELQLEEWNQKEEIDKARLMDWGQRLAVTRNEVIKLNKQYRELLYGFLQEAYAVYKEAAADELADRLFANVRGALLKLNIKLQSNTPDASLIVRLIFGDEASTKSVSEYGKVMQAAVGRGVKADKFAEWLKQETITKVLAEQRAIQLELETPKDRLDRARRLILRLIDIRDAAPIFSYTTTAHTAAKHLGRRYGLCVALGHASRRMDRESFYADLRFSLVIPVGIDFEIYIVDKLARHMMPRLDAWEKDLADLTEEVWADKLFDNLIAACDDEIEKNNEYWANRQQAQLYEDQQEFAKVVKQKKSDAKRKAAKTVK